MKLIFCFLFVLSFCKIYATEPNLSHLFAGLASFQQPEKVHLGNSFSSNMEAVFDQKLAVFKVDNTFYAFTRGNYSSDNGKRNFGIYLLS